MIVRIFRARLKPGKRAEFERLCYEKFFSVVRKQPGCITLRISEPLERKPDEFVLVSIWKDLASLKDFAGERWNEVVTVPGESEMVEEAAVMHYVPREDREDNVYQNLGALWSIDAAALGEREELATRTLRLSDAQWEHIRPLLPAPKREGRPRADDRRTLEGVLYVLRTGCRWQDLPPDYGSSVTCWRRYSQWLADGTWERVWRAVFESLDAPGKLAWARAFFDGSVIPMKSGRQLE